MALTSSRSDAKQVNTCTAHLKTVTQRVTAFHRVICTVLCFQHHILLHNVPQIMLNEYYCDYYTNL